MNPLNILERLFNARALERELSIEKCKSSGLELKVNALTLDNDQLQQKVKKLENLVESFHKSTIKFDESTGTWINQMDGLRYCAKCKASDILSPLKVTDRGWYCDVCQTPYDDPEKRARIPNSPRISNKTRQWL
ncbi:MAG: hypothetical protein P9F75_13570 [Candidatus Contendobacter sp.]|nr:hypothetical protein [Candidatus Contendobacter sp.]